MATGLRWERGDSGRTYRRYERSTGETAVIHAPIVLIDDFLGDVIADQWNICLGSDAQAAGAIIAGQPGGLLRLTSGNNSGTASDDISMLNAGLNFTPSSLYDLNLEVKIRMNTSVATGTMGIGFTDVHSTTGSTEEPFSLSGTTLTDNCTDGVALLYDTAATNDFWHACNTANGTQEATSTAILPVADTFNILRIQISNDLTAKFWVDGVLKHTKASAVTTAVPLGVFAYCNATTTASIVCDIDYVKIWASR